MPLLSEDRLFPLDAKARDLARAIYATIKDLPIISPHGHTDPRWYAENEHFPDPAQLFVTPDHYIFRMLFSQGLRLEDFGVPTIDGSPVETDGRKIWRRFAEHYYLFRATPTRIWLDHSFQTLFDLDVRLSVETADLYYDRISERIALESYRPRALFERFNIEAISTTESALDDLKWHRQIRESGWHGKVVTSYRPDSVIDPDFEGFSDNLQKLGEITNCDTNTWTGYLEAHRQRRAFFRKFGATSTDHGHPSAFTANLVVGDAERLFDRIRSGDASALERETFRGQMLTEMAKMSIEDGMVMQIHPGPLRNHSPAMFKIFGRDKGFDVPQQIEYVRALKSLLDAVGTEPNVSVVVFTLDETAFSRELAPLAGVYPALRIGPPWWFLDSAEGMKRFRETATENGGFYNTVGFNDDTRAFCSIPSRHDVARRVDCAFLAEQVLTGRLDEDEAYELAPDLAYNFAKNTYKL